MGVQPPRKSTWYDEATETVDWQAAKNAMLRRMIDAAPMPRNTGKTIKFKRPRVFSRGDDAADAMAYAMQGWSAGQAVEGLPIPVRTTTTVYARAQQSRELSLERICPKCGMPFSVPYCEAYTTIHAEDGVEYQLPAERAVRPSFAKLEGT